MNEEIISDVVNVGEMTRNALAGVRGIAQNLLHTHERIDMRYNVILSHIAYLISMKWLFKSPTNIPDIPNIPDNPPSEFPALIQSIATGISEAMPQDINPVANTLPSQDLGGTVAQPMPGMVAQRSDIGNQTDLEGVSISNQQLQILDLINQTIGSEGIKDFTTFQHYTLIVYSTKILQHFSTILLSYIPY